MHMCHDFFSTKPPFLDHVSFIDALFSRIYHITSINLSIHDPLPFLWTCVDSIFSSSFAVYRFALVFSSFSLFFLFFSTLSSNPDVWNLRAWRYLSAYKSFDCQSCLVLWTGPFLLSEARIIQGWVTVLDEYSLEFFPSYRRGIQLNRFLYTVKKDSVMVWQTITGWFQT